MSLFDLPSAISELESSDEAIVVVVGCAVTARRVATLGTVASARQGAGARNRESARRALPGNSQVLGARARERTTAIGPKG